MSLRDLLETDVAGLVGALRRFWPWWTEQLSAIFAPLFVKPNGRLLSAQRNETGDYDLRRGERPAGVHRSGEGSPPVVLVLPEERCLTRSVSLPKLSRRDLHSLVTLDVDRLTPFAAPDVWFGLAPAADATQSGLGLTNFASARAVDVDHALQHAQAAHLPICDVAAASPQGLILLNPGSGEKDARLTKSGSRGWLWALLAALIVANIALVVGKDVGRTQALVRRSEAERPRFQQLERMERQIQALRSLEVTRLAERERHEPLRVLAAIARALPTNTTVRTLSFDGATLRLAGRKQSGSDVAAALRSEPSLDYAANTDPSSLPDEEAFDVTAPVVLEPTLRPRSP